MSNSIPYVYLKHNAAGKEKYVVIPPTSVRKVLPSKTFYDEAEAKAYLITNCHLFTPNTKHRIEKLKGAGGTVDDAIARYRKEHVRKLARITQKDYERYLTMLSAKLGPTPINQVTTSVVDSLVEEVANSTTPSVALRFVDVSKAVFYKAVRWGMIPTNPFAQTGLAQSKPRMARWTPQQVKAAVRHAEGMHMTSLALLIRLLYATGQRRGDLLNLTWGQIKNGVMSIRQGKRGAYVEMPLPASLSKHLESMRGDDSATVIPRDTTLEKQLKAVKFLANIPDELQLRDIRRTVITEMFEAGATTAEVMAISGHQSEASVKPYAVRVGNKTLAARAMEKLGRK